jgi:hypothetical protein
MNHPTRGFVTLAVGHRRYLEMAVDLALSVAEHCQSPISLVADEALGRLASDEFSGVFDSIIRLPARFHIQKAEKFGVVGVSPYEEGLFLDADCIVLGSLDPLWPDSHDAEVILPGELLTPVEDRAHHGFSTRALMARFELSLYLKSNSGCFFFRRTRAEAGMEECLRWHRDLLLRELKGGFLGDELALGIVGGLRGWGVFDQPGPMLWPEELAKLDPENPGKSVCHFLGPLSKKAARSMELAVERRRSEAGLPGGSWRHWRWKIRRTVRSRRIGSVLRVLRRISGRGLRPG